MQTRALLPVALFVAGFGGAVAAAGCIIDWADDCGRNHGAPGCKGVPVGAGGGGAGTGAGSSATHSGSGGTGAGCQDASGCPPVPPGPCAALGKVTCTDHHCGIAYEAGDAPSQVYGNCQHNVCSATGTLSTVVATVDGGNAFDDGNPCTNDVCTNGLPQNNPLMDMHCTLGGGILGFCEPTADPSNGGAYVCAQCAPSMPNTCAGTGTTCDKVLCVPGTCYDTVKNGNETDIDCGGSDCLPCVPGKKCGKPSDCFSLVCPTSGPGANACQMPTCTDNVKNEDETGTDCGGSTCPKCPPSVGCSAPSDCTSGVCAPSGGGNTCQAPTCFDGVQNGSETGVDCGGPLDGGGEGDGGAPCPPCAM
jgi:hypothetical protein